MSFSACLCFHEFKGLLRSSGVNALSGFQILTGLNVICG